jgi:crossover junction endodeoxyribonuclease RuvC
LRVLGIDPGSRVTGWGLVDRRGQVVDHVASGTIVSPRGSAMGARLARVHAECLRLVARWRPAAVVLERAFVARNVQSGLRLGEARGAVLAAVGALGTPLHEYAPTEVKLAAVGWGLADKAAVRRWVARRLGVVERALSHDAADALALALCHLDRAPLAARVGAALAAEPRRAPRTRTGATVPRGAERSS